MHLKICLEDKSHNKCSYHNTTKENLMTTLLKVKSMSYSNDFKTLKRVPNLSHLARLKWPFKFGAYVF